MKKLVINVSRFPIRLGQFLKFASIVSDGVEGKALIANGEVRLNGELEFRRGKQLNPGDTILVGETNYVCNSQEK